MALLQEDFDRARRFLEARAVFTELHVWARESLSSEGLIARMNDMHMKGIHDVVVARVTGLAPKTVQNFRHDRKKPHWTRILLVVCAVHRIGSVWMKEGMTGLKNIETLDRQPKVIDLQSFDPLAWFGVLNTSPLAVGVASGSASVSIKPSVLKPHSHAHGKKIPFVATAPVEMGGGASLVRKAFFAIMRDAAAGLAALKEQPLTEQERQMAVNLMVGLMRETGVGIEDIAKAGETTSAERTEGMKLLGGAFTPPKGSGKNT